MPKRCFAFILIAILLFSCKNNNADKRLLEEYEKSLASTAAIINKGTENNIQELQNKMADPVTNAKAAVWYPKAEAIHKSANELFHMIERIKKENAGDSLKNIYLTLNKFKSLVLDDDAQMKETFEKQFDFIENYKNLLGIKDADFTVDGNISNNYLRNVLAITQNAIRQTENRVIQYCNYKVMNNAFIFDVYSAIVGQNAEVLKKGSTLEITAGVGAFSKQAKPLIRIGKDTAMIEEDGAAHYKMNVPQQKGNYSVPVQISYTDQDGKKLIIEKTVEYTVKD